MAVVKEEFVKIVEYKDIGKVSFIRKASVRNLKITIKPFNEVRVIVPGFVSMESAGKFVEEKKSWIRTTQLKLARYENRATLYNEETVYRTKEHLLVLQRHPKATIRTTIGQGKVIVCFPDFADVKDQRVQKAIKKALSQAYRIEATKYLPERLKILAENHNLQFRRITVRDNKTRWGSCSRDNNINLNIHLMRLPQPLCDYVILHELSHTVHKHHQKAFWQFLEILCGGRAKILDRELNKYSPEVW
jgi:predicted metal-dependent hydrolase